MGIHRLAPVWAIRAARLFDGQVRRAGPVVVLVEGQRIAGVDLTGAPPPSDMDVVDLGEVTLLPGFVDSHLHLCFDPTADPVQQMLGEDESALLSRAADNARRALRAGITTVRDLGDRGYVALALRDAAGTEPVPEVLAAGPPITRTRGHCWFLGGEADGTAGVRAAVGERVERGVDVIKVMATGGMLTPGWGLHESQYGPAELRAVVDAAHAQGLPVTAHAHGPRGIADAVAAGVDGVEHGTFVTDTGVEPDAETIAAMARAGTFVGATEAWLPDGPPLPPVAASRLEWCWENFVRMHREGVRIVCCSDAGIGPRKPHGVLPHGIMLFGSLGFTNAEALASATSMAAQACGLADRKGRIAPGYDADLVAVAGDPGQRLAAVLDVRAVFRAGRLVQP
ncbi:MAG: amidohydrolase family protein [Actinomycetota bacterium]|nr:amidohydrolase family protein [Actinomycetota bacterium]